MRATEFFIEPEDVEPCEECGSEWYDEHDSDCPFAPEDDEL